MNVKRILIAAKLLLTSILLIILDIILRYLIETFDVVTVRPLTVPNHLDNYFLSIVGLILYTLFLGGWAYFLVTIIFYVLRRQVKASGLLQLFGGAAVCLISFLAYWYLVDYGEMDLLREGLIVYLILGVCLEILYRILFRYNNQTQVLLFRRSRR